MIPIMLELRPHNTGFMFFVYYVPSWLVHSTDPIFGSTCQCLSGSKVSVSASRMIKVGVNSVDSECIYMHTHEEVGVHYLNYLEESVIHH